MLFLKNKFTYYSINNYLVNRIFMCSCYLQGFKSKGKKYSRFEKVFKIKKIIMRSMHKILTHT